MAELPFHSILGCKFLNHPPMRSITINQSGDSPLLEGLPSSFEVQDEPYLVELIDPANSTVFLSMELSDEDATTPRVHGRGNAGDGGSDYLYDLHPALPGTNGKTVCVAYERQIGSLGGGVVYIALGHCHSKAQRGGQFEGPWRSAPFQRLLENALGWGAEAQQPAKARL